MFTKKIYKIFLCKFNAALKTNTTFFYSPANLFVEEFLSVLSKNNLIQQYIIIENNELNIKNALVYLYPQKLHFIINLQQRSHKSNIKKTYKINLHTFSKYKNIKYLISTEIGLKLATEVQNRGIYLAALSI